MTRMFIWLLVGGGIGAAMGYFGQCTSGTCPLTANWKRGALLGSMLGLAFFLSSGGTASRAVNESTANVKRIDEAQFETEVLRANQPVVVDFYAPWCGPCRRLSPMLDQLAGHFSGHIKVVKVNVDESPGLAKQYQIQGIPALKFFQNGREVDGLVGLPAERELEARLAKLAAAAPGGKTAALPGNPEH